MPFERDVDHAFSGQSPIHLHMAKYIIDQVADGRHLSDVMEDANLTSSLSVVDRRAMLEDPRVTAEIRADIITEMRLKLDAMLGQS